jgi:anti-sigma-K factor RskA
MLEYVAGTLDAPQTETVRQALLSGDPAWAASLAEAEATLTAYASALDPIAPPAQNKSLLMQRVARGQADVRLKENTEFLFFRRLAQGFAAVAAIILVAVLVNAWTARRIEVAKQQAFADMKKQLLDRDMRIFVLQSQIDSNTKVLDALHSPSVKVVDLGSDKSKAVGRILMDAEHGTWHVFTTALAPLPADKTYELWFITADQKKIAGGTFNVDPGGNGMITALIPKDVGPVAIAAITDEPAGGVQVPTGSVQLVGKIQ